MSAPFSSRVIVGFSLAMVLLAVSVGFAAAQPPDQESEEDLATIIRQLKTIALTDSPPVDPLARTAHAMRRYLEGKISEADLLRTIKSARPGEEVRTSLVKSKTRLIQLLGTGEAQYFLGKIYQRDGSTDKGAPRGSELEDRLLDWRSKLSERIKTELASEFKGRNIVNGERHSAFFADVGSQPKGPGKKTVAGDIDVNVMSSNRELATRMVEAAEAKIRAETGGLSSSDVDLVFTVMGMSGPEVYVAEAGRAVAARLIAEGRCGNVRRVDFEAGVIGERWAGPDALRAIAFEEGMRGADVPGIDGLRLPEAGPAAVFEMARHLDRDVLRSMQFEDFDTLFKIAKFVERADLVASQRGHSLDSDLVRFAKDLLEIKSSKDWPRASQLVRGFFGELPVEVQLGRTAGPKIPATIIANRNLLEGFGNRCLNDLMEFGKSHLRDEMTDLRGRLRLAQKGLEDGNALAKDVARLMYDMEVENLVLQNPSEGLRTMDPELLRLTGELHQDHRTLLGSRWEDILTDDLKQQREFVRKMLEQGGETNRQLAAAALFSNSKEALARGLQAITGVNAVLDSLDDAVIGPLRGDTQWRETLLAARSAAISEHSYQTYGRRMLPESANSYLNRAQSQVQRVENYLNPLFYDNFLAKRIQRTNEIFRESVRSSSVGTAAMTGLQVIRLKDEMESYWRALDQGGWSELATEFFRRRVPAGGAVEHVVKGNYGLATWDLFATVVPPAALVQMTVSLGKELGADAWDFYWSTMLKEFSEELYDTATWRIRRTQQLGRDLEIGSWELVAVNYQGREIRIKDYVAERRQQVAEMQDAAKLRPAAVQVRFPYEYASQDPLMGWLAADDILRENLAHADNTLLILDEAKKHPRSGWRRNDHIHKVWTARWEQVKLAFLLRVIDTLERRKRAAEFGAERFNEALLQLHEITDELRITDQVDSSLADESVPPLVVSYLRWLRDAGPEAVVSYFESPTSDKAWIEATRVVLDALEVYDTVLAARDDAEADFVGAGRPKEDSGLRILTTPFLLAGKPAADRRSFERWRSLPLEIQTAVHDELDEIKRVLVPGSALDTADGSFDRRIFGDVVYHDTFRRMWRHVEATTAEIRGSASNLSFELWWELWKQSAFGNSEPGHTAADGFRDRITGADRIAGLGGRELPLERFRAHFAARDQLVAEFVRHYLSLQLAELLTEVDELVTEIEALCTSIRSNADLARSEAENLFAVAEDLATTVALLEPRIDELPERAAVVRDAHTTTEQQTAAMGELAADLDNIASAICRKLEALKATGDPSARHSLLKQMQPLVDRLRSGLEQRTEIWQQVEEASIRTVATQSVFESTLVELDIAAKIDRENDTTGEFEATVLLAEQQLHDLQSRLTQLEELQDEAGVLLDGAREAILSLRQMNEAGELLQAVEAQQTRLVHVVDESRACAERVQTLVETGRASMLEARSEVGAARLSLTALVNRARGSDTQRQELQAKAEAAEYLVSLADSYRNKAEEAADAGALCVAMAGDLIRQSDLITMPNLKGMSAPDAKAKLEALGLTPKLRVGESAPTSHLRFRVAEQLPVAGARISSDAPVTIRIYGDISSLYQEDDISDILNKLDCSELPGTELQWSIEDGTGRCVCPDPTHTWYKQLQDCGTPQDLECARLVTQFNRQMAAKDMQAAGVTLSYGKHCDWHPDNANQDDIIKDAGVAGDCDILDDGFWRLMISRRVDDARGVLVHSNHCDFYEDGLEEIERVAQNRLELAEIVAETHCIKLETSILDACGDLNLGLAQRRISSAQSEGCTVTQDTMQTVRTLAEIEQERRSGYPNGAGLQAWTIVLNGLAAMAGLEPYSGSQPSQPYPDGGGGSSSDWGRVGGGGRSGSGKSPEECERQFCPMCDPNTELDLLSHSIDSQCNDCRKLNHAGIQGCIEGRPHRRTPNRTTKVYRVSCSRSFDPVLGRLVNAFCTILGPSERVPEGEEIVYRSRSWDKCYAFMEEQNAE